MQPTIKIQTPRRLTLAGPNHRSSLSMPAWSLSLLCHVALCLALIPFLPAAPQGAAVEPSYEAGIVLVRREADESPTYISPDDADPREELAQPVEPGAASEETADTLPEATQQTETLPGVGRRSGLPEAAEAQSDGTAGDALHPRAILGGKAVVSVFGTEGQGTSFAFVFDRSASMGNPDNLPLRAAKSELLAAIDGLDARHRFQILFFHESVSRMDARQRLVIADERHKRIARRYVGSILADFGTDHRAALLEALRIGADVTFFLTDGEGPSLTEELLSDVRQRNRHPTALHVIQFAVKLGDDRANPLLQRLASENGGQFRLVSTADLPR